MGLEVLLCDSTKCYMGHSRLGPYRYGEEDFFQESSETAPPMVNWTEVASGTSSRNVLRTIGSCETSKLNKSEDAWPTSQVTKSRTAVILRALARYEFKGSILPYLRSLITELSLQSGGEYEVFLLVQIKDINLDIFSDSDQYYSLLEEVVPPELCGIIFLWSEALPEAWYPKIPEHGVEIQIYQAIQLFSKLRPDFEHFWQFELDSRLIETLEKR